MKKFLGFLLMFVMIVSVSACSNTPNTNPNINLNPSENKVDGEKIVKLTINAQILNEKDVKDKLKKEYQSYVPEDGFFAKDVEIGVKGDDISVQDVLEAYAAAHDLKLDFSDSGGFRYLKSINNIGGGSTGEMSGWLYMINNVMPNENISDNKIKGDENILFIYSNDGGEDIKKIVNYTYETPIS